MKPTYDELLEIVGKQQKRIDALEKEVKRLTNELRQYVNENTPSGSIPPYLKKLEKSVDRYSKDEEKDPPKENTRNERPEHIDREVHHSMEDPICPHWGGHARRRGESTRKRIVIHLHLPTAETVEHISDVYQCTACDKVFSAPVPEALPKAEFDIMTTVFISYLSIAAKMSVDDVRDVLRLFGVNISGGSITNSMKRLKQYLGPKYRELEMRAKSESARYKDETSHRFNGKNFWTWVIATTDWVYYRINSRRSHKVAMEMGSQNGVDVVDGYAGYNKLECDRQRDWSHMLRRAKKPIYDFGEAEDYEAYRRWVARLARLFHNAKEAKKKYSASERLRKRFDDRLWLLLKSAPREGMNIARIVNYIMKFDGEWFAFLQYKEVEPTSNRAERALRPMVIKRRISQQSRGTENMASYAMQMSLYMTSRLQGQNYIENLSNILKSEVSSLPYRS